MLRLVVILIIIMVTFFIYLFRFIALSLKKKKYTLTTGEVTGCRYEKKNTYICYSFTVNDQVRMGEFSSNIKEYQVEGKKIDVYYDEKNPGRNFTICDLEDKKKNLLVLAIALPVLAAATAGCIYLVMPKEKYKINGGGPATEYSCTEKEVYASMISSEISSHMAGSLIAKDTWISLDKDESYTYIETESGQVQYRRYYGRRYTSTEQKEYFKKVTYVAYPVIEDETSPTVLVFVDAFGSYEIAGIEDILQEEFSAEKVAEVNSESPEERKTQLSIPEELNGVGAETATIDSDKYIFLADESGSVISVAEIPYPDSVGTAAEIDYLSWEENELEYCYRTEEKTTCLTYRIFDPDDIHSEMYYAIWDMVDQSEKDAVTCTVNNENTYLWIIEDDYVFYITITNTEDEQLIQDIYTGIRFHEGNYDGMKAAGPQAVRKIQIEADGHSTDVYHTAGLGLWYPDELTELGILDNYPIEMSGTDYIISEPNSLLSYTAEVLTSGSGSLKIDGNDIQYYYAGGLKYSSVLIYDSGTTNKTFVCKAYMNMGDTYLETSLEVNGITEMDTDQLENLITQSFEGCLNPEHLLSD